MAHAAIHHAWFERIHPFVDGNGRVGRLVRNFLLIQHGYPPAVLLKTKRAQYLKALSIADGGNPGPLTEVVARLSAVAWLNNDVATRDPRGGSPGRRARS